MRRSLRFSAFEVVLIAVFAVMASRVIGERFWPSLREAPVSIESVTLKELAARFGPERVSQGPEEWIVRDFFNDRRNGVFVDVGAFEPKKWSNTYQLEHALGWSGVAVDALEELGREYTVVRPKTRFVAAFVTDSDEGHTTLHVDPGELAVSSGEGGFTSLWGGEPQARAVRNRTLDSILEEANVRRVDFLSMDIELGEPAALRAFSIERYTPALVCIEAHGATRQAILNYFADAGYVMVGRYLHLDSANLYFMPRTSQAAAGS